MKVINTDEWARRAPYENFIKYTDPIFSLAVRMDVTALCARHAEKGTSFFADMLYMVSRAVNETEEFRLRLRDRKFIGFLGKHRNIRRRVPPEFAYLQRLIKHFHIIGLNRRRQRYSDNKSQAVKRGVSKLDPAEI